MEKNSCNINDKGKSCCSPQVQNDHLKAHWNKVYSKSPEEKLGWYETDLSPSLNLISEAQAHPADRILIVGAGSTRLVDELSKKGFLNLIATDISEVALENLRKRLGENKARFITDDLTHPTILKDIPSVDFWIDRAVLHFFTKEEEQNIYFDLLKTKVKKNGFVLLAEFSLDGATSCSGLPVHRYSKEILAKKLGKAFKLINSFDYNYIMPSGKKRPYVYTLFQKQKEEIKFADDACC